MHLHFAARVSAESGTILREDDFGSVTGRRDCRANSGHAAPGNENVTIELHPRHMRLAAELGKIPIRWSNDVEVFRNFLAGKWSRGSGQVIDFNHHGVTGYTAGQRKKFTSV